MKSSRAARLSRGAWVLLCMKAFPMRRVVACVAPVTGDWFSVFVFRFFSLHGPALFFCACLRVGSLANFFFGWVKVGAIHDSAIFVSYVFLNSYQGFFWPRFEFICRSPRCLYHSSESLLLSLHLCSTLIFRPSRLSVGI